MLSILLKHNEHSTKHNIAGPLGHEACESFGLRNLVNYLLGSNSTCTILNEVVDF